MNGPSGDERRRRRHQTAAHGRDGEDRDARGEDPAAAEPVAERTADEEQRCEKERVGFDDPLDFGRGRVELRLEDREGDVDHRSVDERHARAQNRRRKNPGLRGPLRGGADRLGAENPFVARRLADMGHGFR